MRKIFFHFLYLRNKNVITKNYDFQMCTEINILTISLALNKFELVTPYHQYIYQYFS